MNKYLVALPCFIGDIREWKYESDGGFYGPVTHYLTNGEERIDFDSKAEALQARATLDKEKHESK